MDWFKEKLLLIQQRHQLQRLEALRQEIDDQKMGGPTPDCLSWAVSQRISEGHPTEEDNQHLAQCPSCRRFAHACAEGYYSPRRRWKRFRSRMGCRWFMFLYRIGWGRNQR